VRGRLARSGVVLLHFTPASPAEAATLVADALAEAGEVRGRLVVVERDRVRIRTLPAPV
jgi:hypothetical protein